MTIYVTLLIPTYDAYRRSGYVNDYRFNQSESYCIISLHVIVFKIIAVLSQPIRQLVKRSRFLRMIPIFRPRRVPSFLFITYACLSTAPGRCSCVGFDEYYAISSTVTGQERRHVELCFNNDATGNTMKYLEAARTRLKHSSKRRTVFLRV